MRRRALVPWKFFQELLPFNAELLNGNAMLIRACGTQAKDGSILRSKEYLLFGNGFATLLPWARTATCPINGYVMNFSEKRDKRQVRYWEVQIDQSQERCSPDWQFRLSASQPDPDDEGHIVELISQSGEPGQSFYLACAA